MDQNPAALLNCIKIAGIHRCSVLQIWYFIGNLIQPSIQRLVMFIHFHSNNCHMLAAFFPISLFIGDIS